MMSAGKLRQGAAQAAGCWIRPAKRLAIYMRDDFSCMYCGRDLHSADAADVTLDHLVCRSHGGSNEADNLVTACRSCNSARGAKSVEEYAPGGALERIALARIIPLNVKLAKAIIAGECRPEEDAR
jgi:hypothetical protein